MIQRVALQHEAETEKEDILRNNFLYHKKGEFMKGKAHRKQLSRNLNIDNSRVDREFRRNEVKFEKISTTHKQLLDLSFFRKILGIQ